MVEAPSSDVIDKSRKIFLNLNLSVDGLEKLPLYPIEIGDYDPDFLGNLIRPVVIHFRLE